MVPEWTTVNSSRVLRDKTLTHRWYAAEGPNVRKWEFDASKVVSTTTAAGSTVTVTNGTLVTADSVTGGAITLTVSTGSSDKVELQSTSELFYFAYAYPAYFGIKIGQLVDADQTGISLGFIIRDTDIAGGVTDGVYFRVVDQSANLYLVLEKDAAETATLLTALTEATDYVLELYYDGAGYVHAYVDGVLATSVATSNANWPNDEHLCGTIAIQNGEGSANTAQVYWARAFQVQETS